ncbi:DNA-directed DNA polymerase alpha subunit pol12 [Rhizophlyctis rosea]|nr:DNA-directed DNA polymerase alpha subunit pol12 [Rhizophlyctis rosea]
MLRAEATRSDIIAAFPGIEATPQVVDRLISIAKVYQVDADSLSYKWDAIALALQSSSKDSDRDFTLPTLDDTDEIQKRVQQEFEKKTKERAGITNTVFHRKEVNPFVENRMLDASSLDLMLQSGQFATPNTGRKKVLVNAPTSGTRASAAKPPISPYTQPKTPKTPLTARRDLHTFTDPSSPTANRSSFASSPFAEGITSSPTGPSPHAIRFADRLDKAKKEDIFNEHVPYVPSNAQQPVRCEIALPPGQQTEGYRYMFEKLTDKGDMIDERIDHFANLIAESVRETLPEQDREDFALAHPAQPSQESIITVGRVCCDSIAESAKLNEQSVVLETSRAIGAGCRVKLNLNDLTASGKGFALFPGQIIGVEGTNPSGRLINVSRIILPPLPDPVTTPPSELLRLYPQEEATSKQPLNIVIATGPYTLDDSLNFEPFEAFITQITEKSPPDVVILLGPFIDSSHPMIVDGEVDVTLDTLFAQQISSRLHRLLASRAGMKVILVPSTRDAVSEWCVFPQPPLGSGVGGDAASDRRKALDIPGGVMLFPNPVQFQVNEVVFGVSSMDCLMHLGGEEVARPERGTKPDRMGRLFGHVLGQRTFYPLHPPPEDACLDMARWEAMEVKGMPDVLVLGSGLRFCARGLGGVVCVNPGGVCKGRSGGTFARVCVHPLDLEGVKGLVGTGEGDGMDVDEVPLRHEVGARCRVEILRV